MEVVAHPDPFVLEQDLLERVEACRPERSLEPVLILVPTRMLAMHVRRRMAERREAWLGVEVLTFRQLAHRILSGAPEPPPRIASRRILEALLGGVLDKLRDSAGETNPWPRFTHRRPRALRELLSSLNDLREAGSTPAELTAAASTPAEHSLGKVYRAYVEALEQLAAQSSTDEAGFIARAAERAEPYAARYAAVFVHGAYELVGMHLDLVRHVDRARGVTVLLPVDPGSPAAGYAERYAERHLLQRDKPTVRVADRAGGLLGARLTALYDESATPGPMTGDTVAFRHAQGSASEVSVALRHVLRAVEQGVPPAEIALVARSLEPYAGAIEENLATDRDDSAGGNAGDGSLPGVVFTTTLKSPLRRQPVIRDLLLLLRVLAEDFPRAPTVELLRSPRIRWKALVPDEPPPRGDLADGWSRRAGILGGLEEWTSDLATWASTVEHRDDDTEERRAEREQRAQWKSERARRIAAALAALRDRLPTKARPWADHAEELEKLVREVLPGTTSGVGDDEVQAFLGLLQEMRDLSRLPGNDGDVEFDTMRRWLERAVDETGLPHQQHDNGGIRVIDAMQARGLTFRRLFLLGFHAKLFPRVPRQDPFLPDDLRRRLVESTGRPLPIKLESDREEHLLLSMLLGAAGERLDVSWQRADESGRARVPSLALRELARLVYGEPAFDRLLKNAQRVSAHPAQRLEGLANSTGLLTRAEDELWVALRSTSPDVALAALAARRPDLEAGLAMLCTTESFAPADPRYDGRLGVPFAPDGGLSVTSLQRLGNCPLQFFFRDVLKVYEPDEEASPYEIEFRELGNRIHGLLESLYRRLADEGLFQAGGGEQGPLFAQSEAAERVARAVELVDPLWEEHMGDLQRRRSRRLRLLWDQHAAAWKASLRQFVARDLRRLEKQQQSPIELETERRATLSLGEDVEVEVNARFDRALAGSAGPVVGDYKTRGNLKKQSNLSQMLKGHKLQVPLYWMLTGGEARVELLGVGPEFDLESDDPDRPAHIVFDGPPEDGRYKYREAILETLRVLVRLTRGGVFPLNSGDYCNYCAYVLACRRKHPPTEERESNARDSAAYRDLGGKNYRQPTLADVRRKRREKREGRR